MKRSAAVLLALVALAFGAACAHQSGGIAASNVPLEPGAYEVLGPVKGQDCVYYLLGLLPVSGSNHTKAAVDAALRRRPSATALVGITSDTYAQTFLVVTRSCIVVEATAVRH
jgi:hypothetical protein